MFDSALLLAAAFCGWCTQCRGRRRRFPSPCPPLVFTGVPPVVANATGTVALLPGYIAGAWGFRDTAPPPGLSIRLLVVLSLIGGAAGARCCSSRRMPPSAA